MTSRHSCGVLPLTLFQLVKTISTQYRTVINKIKNHDVTPQLWRFAAYIIPTSEDNINTVPYGYKIKVISTDLPLLHGP